MARTSLVHCCAMLWRRTLVVPGCFFALNLLLFVWGRLAAETWSPLRTIAPALLAAGCASILAVVPLAVTSFAWICKQGQLGRIDPFNACRTTYCLAYWTSVFLEVVTCTVYTTTVSLLISTALPLGLAVVANAGIFCLVPLLVGRPIPVRCGVVLALTVVLLSGLGMLYAMFASLRSLTPLPLVLTVALCAAAITFVSAPVCRTRAGAQEEDDVVRLSGRAMPLGAAGQLGPFVEQLARSLHVVPPRHVVVGIYPLAVSVARDVAVGEEVLRGGTLYLSAPMCRHLERGELAGIVAADMARGQIWTVEWRCFIERAWAQAAGTGLNPPGRVLSAAVAATRVPIELWMQTWRGMDLGIDRWAAQRGAVMAGRETMAAALARQFLYPTAWQPFVLDLIREARGEVPPPEDKDVSGRLAMRLSQLAREPDFIRTFQSSEALRRAYPALALLIESLGVDPTVVADRMRSSPVDPAIDLIDGAADAERDLGLDLIARLKPEWPWQRRPRAQQPAEADKVASHVFQAVAPKAEADGRYWNVRPVFELPKERWTIEGVTIAIAGALLALCVAWMVAAPLVYRVFPDFRATKTGPPGFPVTVHVGTDTIGFTNGSGEPWVCRAAIGSLFAGTSYTIAFSLAAGQRRELAYLDFRSPGPNLRPAAPTVRAAARAGMIDCVEPSGKSHEWGWW